jgi:hypothetical protein
LTGKVDSFLPLLQLKHEQDFAWGGEQEATFNKIKEYLVSPRCCGLLCLDRISGCTLQLKKKVIGAALT